MVYVYVLKSLAKNRLYIGMTTDVNKRLKQHNSGYTKSTKGYRPWALVYTETFSTREEARKREKFLKSGVGREFIKSKMD